MEVRHWADYSTKLFGRRQSLSLAAVGGCELFGGAQSFDDVSRQGKGSDVNIRVVIFRLQVQRIPAGEVNGVRRVKFLRRVYSAARNVLTT